jgi:hypothetical protein
MSRSLRVQQGCLDKVKLALKLNGFPSQRAFAEDAGYALATVSNFLTGKPVDYTTFEELSRRLALNWREISTIDLDISSQPIDKSIEQDKPIEHVGAIAIDQGMSPCYPSGAVPLDSPFYLERSYLKAQICQEITKPGALVRIKAPREMGKTSLLLRVLDFAKQLDYRIVNLNLEQVDQAILSDLRQFLRWLCANMARQLQLEPRLDEYWDEDLGSKISCTSYFQDYLLKSITTPLVLALDEVNQIFEHPQVAKDVLPLLRSWHEEAKTLPIWRKLRLIVVHSTEIYVPLDLSQSPFNVGLPIQLYSFTQKEVQQLAQCYGLNWEDGKELSNLMNLVGGHPALVHTAIYHLSYGRVALPQLLATAATATGIYSHHLQRHWVALQKQPELVRSLYAVISTDEPTRLDRISFHKLSSLGLVKQLEDRAIANCELYRQYFSNLLN